MVLQEIDHVLGTAESIAYPAKQVTPQPVSALWGKKNLVLLVLDTPV